MTGQDLLLVLLGLYLAAGLVVAAWGRASGTIGGLALWVAGFGAWTMGAGPRWLPLSPLLALALAFSATGVSLLLARMGRRLCDRVGPGRLVWLLGPVHALGLAASWVVDARRRSGAGAESPLEGAGTEVQEALESVVELGETTVGEIMVPRSEIAALEDVAGVAQWVAEVHVSRHRSIPVYREDLDEILGYLDIEDLFRAPDPAALVGGFVRELRFVPESMRCDDLLRELIAQEERIAVVVDEFGGTAGLVSDQDLFEILLGEISDQNPFEGRVVRLEEQLYLTDGHYRIDDFNEWSPVPFPEGDYETVAGLILDRLGKIPPEGESIEINRTNLEVISATERRILKVHIRLPAAAPSATPSAGAGAGIRGAEEGAPHPANGTGRKRGGFTAEQESNGHR